MYAQSCPILFDLMDCVACQAPLSMEFSRQEYWVSCHFLIQGIFPTQGLNPGPRIEPISPVSPALAGRFFTLRHLGSPYKDYTCTYIKFILLLCGVPYPQSWKVHCTKSFYIKGLNITDFHIQGDHLNRHIDNLWKISLKLVFSSVQSLSRVQLFVTPWIAACQSSLSITNSQSSLPLMSIKSVMPSSHLILCCPFSFCPQTLPASGSFPMSQLVAWDGQSTGISALASILPMNTQDWFPLGWTSWISLHSKGLSRVFNTTVQKH